MKNINNFIKEETMIFETILKYQNQITKLEKKKFRKETIEQRKYRVFIEIYNLFNGVVFQGPFKNLKLNIKNLWSCSDLGSMILGYYEMEVLKIFASLKNNQYKNFINIGAADGYYVCGAFLSNKFKKIVCYEQNIQRRNNINKNLRLNNFKNIQNIVTIFSSFTKNSLARLNKNFLKDSLVLIDIEGSKFKYLQEETLLCFTNSTLIIEIHHWIDNFIPKYTNFLRIASKYFKISPIVPIKSSLRTNKKLNHLHDDNLSLLLSEGRPSMMRFLKLSPKKRNK